MMKHTHTLSLSLVGTSEGRVQVMLFLFRLALNCSPLLLGCSEVNHNAASHFLTFSRHVELSHYEKGTLK